jgi:hypothetical protein
VNSSAVGVDSISGVSRPLFLLFELRLTRFRMSRTIKPRPSAPPIEPAVITSVLIVSLFAFTGASVEVADGVVKESLKGAVEEDVDTKFPTVESGAFTNCIACACVGENESEVTTSR